MKKYLAHYKPDGGSYLKEVAGIGEPTNRNDWGDHVADELRTQYIASLQTIPCPSMEKEFDGRIVKEGEFEVNTQYERLTEQEYNSQGNQNRDTPIVGHMKKIAILSPVIREEEKVKVLEDVIRDYLKLKPIDDFGLDVSDLSDYIKSQSLTLINQPK